MNPAPIPPFGRDSLAPPASPAIADRQRRPRTTGTFLPRHPPMLRFAALLALTPALRAQDPPGTPPPPPGADQPQQQQQQPLRTVVTATRSEGDPFEVPYSTTLLDQVDLITFRQVRTIPEALREQAGISVQKTAHGQGSPKFRGQTGFQTLLLVDGIRINDSTWRSGNVEYWNHLDPYAFERFEIVRGPSGVLWGSDATTGVGHAFSKRRHDFAPGVHVNGGALFRYATAEKSAVSHFELDGNASDFGWHVGITYKDFDDLKAGRDVGVLPDTGYTGADGDLSLVWRLSERSRLTFAAQHDTLRDVPRTHSTTANVGWRGITAGSDVIREHTHRRWLTYLKYEAEDTGGLFDDFWVTFAFKQRYEREHRLRSNGRRTFQTSQVDTPAIVAQGVLDTAFGELTVGVDWYHDMVDSEQREHDGSGNLLSALPRGVVAGDARYDLAGIFLQDRIGIGEDTELTLGARYQYVNLSADDVAAPGITTVDHVSDHWHAVTGSMRLLHRLNERVRLFGGLTQGFRAPNLSDTTRLDVARTNELEIPATDLDPEYSLTAELGARYRDDIVHVSVTGYHSWVKDQIGRFRTGGMSGGQFLVTKDNVGDGWYTGLELEGGIALGWLCECLENWSLVGMVDYVTGRVDQVDSSGTLVHNRPGAMPPVSGRIGLRWDDPRDRAGFELFTLLARHVDPSRYTESDAQNTSRIPPDGLPGYAVLGVRGFYRVTDKTTVSAAVENLNDVDYRIMDSGLNEPGTNAVFTVETRF